MKLDMNGWVSIDFMVASMIILLTIPGIVAISGRSFQFSKFDS